MKLLNIKFIVALALLVTVSVGCNKRLEVEPRQSVDASTAISTPEDLNSAVVGLYSLLASGALYGTDLILLPDLLASSPGYGATSASRYLTWAGTFTSFRQVYNKNMNRDNAEASRLWITGYRAINSANVVLSKLSVATDATLKQQYEGEALFVRGALHFELVRYYGLPWGARQDNSQPGIVIRTSPTTNADEASVSSPRNTVAEVYARAIEDLKAAAEKLPAQNGTRVTRYAALAILSRLYLQQGDYNNALQAASEVIESGNYKLNASVSATFSNKNTAESIWEIQQNDQNNAGTSNDGMATFYASYPGIGRADIRVTTGFINSYPANDLRKTEWYYVGTGARPGNSYTSKWKSFSQNLPVIRLAELYLTRAECNIRLGSSVGDSPANDLAEVRNTVRTNSTAPANPTLNNVLQERLWETAFEGLRIHDIKRLRLDIVSVASGILAWNSDLLVFPIPQREVDATSGIIVQNPGY
jgi:tetratricopeptide (TPR) repeat protein